MWISTIMFLTTGAITALIQQKSECKKPGTYIHLLQEIPVYGQNCSPIPNKIMLFNGEKRTIQLTVIWKVSFKHPSQMQFPFKKTKNHRISISADKILSLCSYSSKDRTSNSILNNQWAQWEQLMNPQPHRKKKLENFSRLPQVCLEDCNLT